MRKLLGIVALVLLAQAGCKRRSMKEIQVTNAFPSSSDLTSEADLDRLKQERNELIAQLEAQQVEGARLIAELTLERDELNTQKSSIELNISRLQKELEASTSPEERTQIQLKLDNAVKERDELVKKLEWNAEAIRDLLQKMDALSDEIRKANAKISDLNDRIEVLENELAIERSKVETISVSSLPKADAPGATAATPAPTPSTGSPVATTQGVVSTIAWQLYRQNADNTQSCFEFGSTLSGAALLGLPCVTPPPTRQQFKTESFGSQFLLVDQRTQMCVRLDSAATAPASARVLLGACKRGGDMDELWTFTGVNIDTGEFQLQSVKTGNCLHIGTDRRVVQLACDQAVNLLSAP
jgi:TolA-binding protein